MQTRYPRPVVELHPCAARPPGDTGFTLIEVLVALAILAVAAAGLIGAAERHVDTIRALERRTAALWVAENHVAELTVSSEAMPATAQQVEMLGRIWSVQISRRASDDPDLDAMRISVGDGEQTEPVVILDFFRERGRGETQ